MNLEPLSSAVHSIDAIQSHGGISAYKVGALASGQMPTTPAYATPFEIVKEQLGYNYKRTFLYDIPENSQSYDNICYWSSELDSINPNKIPSIEAEKSYVTSLKEHDVEVVATTNLGTKISFMTGPSSRDGDKINTLKLERMDHLNVVIALTENVRINEDENGSLTIYYPETGKRQIFDKYGNYAGTLLNGNNEEVTDKEDIFINLKGGQVDLGDGNHTVINACDNTSIYAGDGDNHIINVGRVTHNVNVVCGNGNNNLEMHGCYDGSVTTGNGNNTLSGLLASTSVNMGAGNHVIRVNGCTADIKVGAGDTRLETTYYTGKIRSQGGGLLQITFPNSAEKSQSLVSAEIETDGDLDINVGSLCGRVTVAGKTRMMVDSAYSGPLMLQSSDSNDDIYIGNGIGTINTGGGNDSITVESWKGTVNGQIVPRFEGIIGSRLETAFRDPFFASYHSSNFSRELWNAVNINR